MYRVYFIDKRDGLPNEKLLKANCIEDIYTYMNGHKIIHIEEV